MDSLKNVLKTKEGITGVILILAGIIVACAGGFLFQTTKFRDLITIGGSIISLIGTQSISRMIIENRDQKK